MVFRAAGMAAMSLGLTLEREEGYEGEARLLLEMAGQLEAKAGALLGRRPSVPTEGGGLRQAADIIDTLDHADDVMRADGVPGERNWMTEFWDEDGRQWDAKRLFPGAFRRTA